MENSKSFHPGDQLESKDAIGLIREITINGTVTYSNHARDRMDERGYTMRDALHVLRCGTVVGSEFEKRNGNWKYRVQGYDLDGSEGTVVTAILSLNHLLIITVC